MIFNSPAYQSGKMLVVVTFDESGLNDARACQAVNQADCDTPSGPNVSNFLVTAKYWACSGYQKAPTTSNVYPGGGQVGAVVFNKHYIKPGSVNTTGYYNHFSSIRSYEDLLGLHKGGSNT